MKKLATIGEYKTAASANTCWYNLKKKLFDTPNPTTTTTTSPSSPATQANAVNLTPADLKLLNLIWQCLDGETPKVDNKKLAQLGGYKTTASANTCWYNLRKKLFASQDGSAAAPGTAAAGSVSSSPVGKVRSTPTRKKKEGKSDAAGLASPASKNGAGSGRMSGGAKKRAVDCDDAATTSAMDETPSKKLKGQKAMMEEGSEALSTIAAAGSEADVKDAEGSVKGSDYVVPKLEPLDDTEDVLTGGEGMESQESSEGVVKVKEEDTQIMPAVYADESVTSTTAAVAATDGEEQGDEDAGVRFFQQMREFAEE
ncbi:hypothetical protein KC333_g8905 [Hortaea werneckii]|nr:hypothetical protein KC333_g8905 [Hortaea werneckii]KAI7302670.1 hypothetical protein KC326_g8899 [Hortaea werneckii]